MYQDTGNSSSWANTATPRPHRRPVHSAQPAASTTAADDREPRRGAELVQAGLVGAAEAAHDVDHRGHETRSALERPRAPPHDAPSSGARRR